MAIKKVACSAPACAQVSAQALQASGASLPQAFCEADAMARLARAMAREEQLPFCTLPFCHTLEAESMGAHVRMDDSGAVPRPAEPLFSSLDELAGLPVLDESAARVEQTLAACAELRAQSEQVMWRQTGPFALLSAFIDSAQLVRGLRKEPQLALDALRHACAQGLRLTSRALDAGARLVGFADTSCNVQVLGPRTVELVVREVLLPHLQALAELVRGRASVVLCPQVLEALVGAGCACLEARNLPNPLSFAQACLEVAGRETFLAHGCIEGPGMRAACARLDIVHLACTEAVCNGSEKEVVL